MPSLVELYHQLSDVRHLVQAGGYIGVTSIIFAETGLLIGFFLPGDSLLVTAGLLSSQPVFGLDLYWLGAILTMAAILGNTVGYWIGFYSGPRLFTRDESMLFRKKHLLAAHAFYERHGGKTLVIARFMPIVRTFVPVVAGFARMDFKRYTAYNVLGAVLWIWSMLLIGFVLGRYIPGVERHIEKVILLVIFVSLLPGIISWYRGRSKNDAVDAPSPTGDA